MSAHTPGPWRYEEGTKTIRAVPSNYWLASMNSWDGAVDHAANARLIAAAPKLLEVLEWLLAPANQLDEQDAIDAARAAIRAAKGESNG